MGYDAQPSMVLTVLNGLEHTLRSFEVKVPYGSVSRAARQAYPESTLRI
jgi:aspartate aminotransferase-like enzyme